MNANSYIDLEHYKYVTVDDAPNLCQTGCWLPKVDLKNAGKLQECPGVSMVLKSQPTFMISASLLEPGDPQ